MEHASFTQQEVAAFNQLVRVLVRDLLPFVKRVFTSLFSTTAVEQLALSTPYALRHGSDNQAPPTTTTTTKDTTPTSSWDAAQLMSRGRPKLDLGMELDVDRISEPLKRVAPSVFEEMEALRRHEFAVAVNDLHDSRERENDDGGGGGGASGLNKSSEMAEKVEGGEEEKDLAVVNREEGGVREKEGVLVNDVGSQGGESERETAISGGLRMEDGRTPTHGSLMKELKQDGRSIDTGTQVLGGQSSSPWQQPSLEHQTETTRTMNVHHTPLAKDKAA